MRISEASWVFLDTETTGVPRKGQPEPRIIEIGLVSVKSLEIEGSAVWLIDPEGPIPPEITKITGIRDTDVRGEGTFRDLAPKLLPQLAEADFLAAFNKDFDRKMLESEFKRLGQSIPQKVWLDPLTWSRHFETGDHKLKSVADRFKMQFERAHRADADAEVSAKILIEFFRWGLEEAAFPDDLEAMKAQEKGWKTQQLAKAHIMDPLKGKDRKAQLTGKPGELAQDSGFHEGRDLRAELEEGFDELMRKRLQAEASEWMYRFLREKWSRRR